ncbi:MAG: DUF4255 domain-containing protein [Eubacterium sp.]|nr:DUF4255 domain-containing protein [Eubacterium sp.]
MGYSMITDVGEYLVGILTRALVPDVITHSGAIGLCSPDEHGDYRVGIYLYGVSPSDDVIQTGMVNSGLSAQTFPSTFLTLDYMVTAYSTSDLKFRAGEEQKIIGSVIQAFGDARVIPAEKLGLGASAGVKIELQRLTQEEKIKLWMFPETPYKMSLFYRVSPVEISSAKTTSIVRVRDIDMYVDEDRVLAKTAIVVLPIDDFTGRAITGSNVSVQIDGERPPVNKSDGYRIFTNMSRDSFTLRFRSALYEPVSVDVDMNGRDPGEILTVRLVPGRSYPLPGGTTTVVVSATPDSSFRMWEPEGRVFKIQKDYKTSDGRELALYNPENRAVEGRGFFITASGKQEWLRITSHQEKKYAMEKPLEQDYARTETELLPVHEVVTGKSGQAFFPLRTDNAMTGDMIKINYQTPDGKTGEFMVEAGRENRITIE